MLQQLLDAVTHNKATLIAVSKTKPIAAIETVYAQGQRHFGENKVQELVDKFEALPKDILWHMIGHLQKNKVKYIAPFIHCIHSIDSMDLLYEVQKQAAKNNKIISVLLQFHIAEEDTKFGLNMLEASAILDIYTSENNPFTHIHVSGVMGMATFTDNVLQIEKEFKDLQHKFTFIKQGYFPFNTNFKEISMGMSSDYQIALANGSTMIRVGSLLFGERNYN